MHMSKIWGLQIFNNTPSSTFAPPRRDGWSMNCKCPIVVPRTSTGKATNPRGLCRSFQYIPSTLTCELELLFDLWSHPMSLILCAAWQHSPVPNEQSIRHFKSFATSCFKSLDWQLTWHIGSKWCHAHILRWLFLPKELRKLLLQIHFWWVSLYSSKWFLLTFEGSP